jgi:hypothetical protein
MDKYRFEFGKDESGKYVDGYKNGNKIPLISDINNIEWVKYSDVKDFLESKIQIFNLKPNDILVLKTSYVLSEQALYNIKKYLKNILVESGYDNEILIILTTDELQIIRKDD